MPRDRAAWRGGGAGPLPSAISRAGVDADADVDLQPELAPKVAGAVESLSPRAPPQVPLTFIPDPGSAHEVCIELTPEQSWLLH